MPTLGILAWATMLWKGLTVVLVAEFGEGTCWEDPVPTARAAGWSFWAARPTAKTSAAPSAMSTSLVRRFTRAILPMGRGGLVVTLRAHTAEQDDRSSLSVVAAASRAAVAPYRPGRSPDGGRGRRRTPAATCRR